MAVRDPAAARARVGRTKPIPAFDSVKVFSTTMLQDRRQLGDAVTEWLAAHPEFEVADIVITQSSDSRFHCLSVSLFLRTRHA